MPDKTGMEILLPVLENLYLDYLAFRQIAKAAEPEKWAVHVNSFKNAKRSQVSAQFEAVAADLRNNLPSHEQSCNEAARRVANLLLDAMVTP